MISVDPSQGSHFFQNITSLRIPFVTVIKGTDDTLDWQWLNSIPVVTETAHLKHVMAHRPFVIKIDGSVLVHDDYPAAKICSG